LLGELGLAAYAGESTRILSRGLRQRLSLARALIHEPALLLLDEPFTGLDPNAADSLRSRLAATRLENSSLILVTHRVEDGLALTDRWIMLRRGRVGASGRSAETEPSTVMRAYRSRRARA
jgi:heme exporter protein A